MALDPRLLKLLACPACKGALEPRGEPEALVCAPCRRRYPVKDGIPVMIPELAEQA